LEDFLLSFWGDKKGLFFRGKQLNFQGLGTLKKIPISYRPFLPDDQLTPFLNSKKNAPPAVSERSCCASCWQVFLVVEKNTKRQFRAFWKIPTSHDFIWGVPKIVVPQIIQFNRVFDYKPSNLGYPYFWKHPSQATHHFQTISLHPAPTPT